MFRPQAQAETHSGPGGAPRTSSPTHAETHSEPVGAHAPHHRKAVAILQHLFFFYLCIDYKHKHTAAQGACYVVHALNCVNFFYFFYF